jgi:hypothetical protein
LQKRIFTADHPATPLLRSPAATARIFGTEPRGFRRRRIQQITCFSMKAVQGLHRLRRRTPATRCPRTPIGEVASPPPAQPDAGGMKTWGRTDHSALALTPHSSPWRCIVLVSGSEKERGRGRRLGLAPAAARRLH